MASLKSKIVIGLIKNRHLFKGKLKPEVIDETFSVEKFRRDIDKASNRMKLPQDVSAESVKINGIYAEWIAPENPPDEKVLMYIHGGDLSQVHVLPIACMLQNLPLAAG